MWFIFILEILLNTKILFFDSTSSIGTILNLNYPIGRKVFFFFLIFSCIYQEHSEYSYWRTLFLMFSCKNSRLLWIIYALLLIEYPRKLKNEHIKCSRGSSKGELRDICSSFGGLIVICLSFVVRFDFVLTCVQPRGHIKTRFMRKVKIPRFYFERFFNLFNFIKSKLAILFFFWFLIKFTGNKSQVT